MTSDGASGGSFARVVRETLDTVAAPMVREALILDALSLGGLAAVPEDAIGLRRFASGPLFTVTERALGRELAASITDEIVLRIPLVRPPSSAPNPPKRESFDPPTVPGPTALSSPARRQPRRPASVPPRQADDTAGRSTSTPPRLSRPAPPSAPPPVVVPRPGAWPRGFSSHIRGPVHDQAPPSSHGRPIASPERVREALLDAPFVLVSTEDDLLFQTLKEWFGDRGRVCHVRTTTEIVRYLDEASGARSIVIIDGKNPGVRPASVAVLLEDEPQVEVVLCRVAEATEQVVLSSHPGTRRWIVYREPASLDHVAAECVRLVS